MTHYTQATRWWTEQGPDICEGCQVLYYAEDGYYCGDCDRGICATCIAFTHDAVLRCAFCHSEQQKKHHRKTD